MFDEKTRVKNLVTLSLSTAAATAAKTSAILFVILVRFFMLTDLMIKFL
jgi:hypothetical protein